MTHTFLTLPPEWAGSRTERHLVLVGLPGCGKTTVGQGVAGRHAGALDEKVEILEECQHADIGQDTGNQHPALCSSLKFFQTQTGKVIHRNGHSQDQDVFGDERHVEITAGSQQQQPAEAMRQ